MTEKLKRQLDRLEHSIAPRDDAPLYDVELVLVATGGQITRRVMLSELTKAIEKRRNGRAA